MLFPFLVITSAAYMKRISELGLSYEVAYGMNTRLEVVMWGSETIMQQACFNRMVAELIRWESVLSRFDPNSEVFRFNACGTGISFCCSDELWSSIGWIIDGHDKTGGLFDAFYLSDAGHSRQLDELIEYHAESQTVVKKSGDVRLDFGGVGKGIYLQEVNNLLDYYAIENALISFGGSSILARGHHPHDQTWPFAFQQGQGIVETFFLKDTTLSISGLQNGRAHINPAYDNPGINDQPAVVVQSTNPIECEMISTALFVANDDQSSSILSNFETQRVLRGTKTLA